MTQPTAYRGRFAPSPTGPLHLGSLIAALASYLDARANRGEWLVRMEDLDPPREEAGAADAILRSLRAHGLHWDGEVMYQAGRDEAYRNALDDLAAAGHLFACDCTRATLGPDGACAGRCRPRQDRIRGAHSLRVAVPPDCVIGFADGLQGSCGQALGEELPDFVLVRKDGLTAYQLAVVVDDCAQGVTHVVRGADLLDSTARQIYLQGLLHCPTPEYLHLPVITGANGRKLSKQTQAPALDDAAACDNLRLALRFLGQALPAAASPPDLVAAAVADWNRAALPAAATVPAATLGL